MPDFQYATMNICEIRISIHLTVPYVVKNSIKVTLTSLRPIIFSKKDYIQHFVILTLYFS